MTGYSVRWWCTPLLGARGHKRARTPPYFPCTAFTTSMIPASPMFTQPRPPTRRIVRTAISSSPVDTPTATPAASHAAQT